MKASQKIFLRNKEGKLLALKRSETDPSRPLTWDLPGGEIEEGEDLTKSIQREILEETGIHIPTETIVIHDAMSSTNKKGEYSIQIAYTAEVDMPEVLLSHEHVEYKWLTKGEFIALESSPKIQKFLSTLS